MVSAYVRNIKLDGAKNLNNTNGPRLLGWVRQLTKQPQRNERWTNRRTWDCQER